MGTGTLVDFLRMIANRNNLVLLSSLAAGPDYPRRLAGRHGLQETHVANRLRSLERAGLVRGAWTHADGRNVRLYQLTTKSFTVEIRESGYEFQMQALEAGQEPFGLERVPVRGAIFGREKDLAGLSDSRFRFSIVVGLPGMGKTSLATELAYRFGVERVVWHTFTPFDSASRLLGLAQRWIVLLDPALGEKYERQNWDIAETLERVTDRLSEQRALIILDDYQKVRDDGIHEVVRRWQRTLVNARVVVLSRNRPPFDLDATTQLRTLGALDRAASLRLLREYGLNASLEETARLERAFGGHPLSLRLYAQQPTDIIGNAQAAIEDVGRQAFKGLDGNSQQVLLALAAVRRPLTLDGIRFITGLAEPSPSLGILERQAMIRSVGREHHIHDVLRESLSSIVASRPEIHRRATALFLPSKSQEDIVEALYHTTKVEDWTVAGNLLEKQLAGERDMPSGGVNQSVYLEILDQIPVAKLRGDLQRATYHRYHALARLGMAKTSSVIRELQIARRIAESLNDSRLLGLILSPLGFYLGQTGDMEQAERLLVRNLRLTESAGTPADRSTALLMLSLHYDRLGEHARARENWKLAVRESRRTGNKRVVLDLLSWWVGFPVDWRKMLPRLLRYRAAFRRWNMPNQVAAVDCTLGEILCRAERYRKVHSRSDIRRAISLLERAIAAFETMGDRYQALYARSWLGLAQFIADEHDVAERTAKAALDGDTKIGPSHAAILSHQVLSRVDASRGENAAAVKHSKAAVRRAGELRCGCLGIAMLERAVQQIEGGNGPRQRRQLEAAIGETIRKGRPDEVRYARDLAAHYRIGPLLGRRNRLE